MNNKKKVALGSLLLGVIGTGAYLINSRKEKKKVEFKTVQAFELKKFLGRWYEIARIDFKYEKNLSNCIAKYIINDDGSFVVINTGYDKKKKIWKKSEGKAKVVDEKNGKLKVSFFSFFYNALNVVDIDENYQNALLAGKNHDYLWILSRDKEIDDSVRERFLTKAKSLGYDTNRLLWTSQVPIES
ncbi:lipocalin family protein [Vaginella massiliensis]|uniref:lipocalin family protein n=1 Tax=Vaginella massiliensis TaxID=1816680 RepID=UPI003752AAB7